MRLVGQRIIILQFVRINYDRNRATLLETSFRLFSSIHFFPFVFKKLSSPALILSWKSIPFALNAVTHNYD